MHLLSEHGYLDMILVSCAFWFVTIPYLCLSYLFGVMSVKSVGKCGDEKLIGQSKKCLKWFKIWLILFGVVVLAHILIFAYAGNVDDALTTAPEILYFLSAAVICQTPTPIINAYFAVQLFETKKTSFGVVNALSCLFTAVPSIVAAYCLMV